MNELDIRKGNGYGFRAQDGNIYLQRCFACGKENWAPAVASGQCAWCGYDANKDDFLQKEEKKRDD